MHKLTTTAKPDGARRYQNPTPHVASVPHAGLHISTTSQQSCPDITVPGDNGHRNKAPGPSQGPEDRLPGKLRPHYVREAKKKD